MPAGELIEEDWDFEIRATLLGPRSVFKLRRNGIKGFRGRRTLTGDSPLLSGALYGGTDAAMSFEKVIELRTSDPDPEVLEARIGTFEAAWALGGDEEMHWQQGSVHYYLIGRTRDFDVNEDERNIDRLHITAQFVPTDPAVYVYGS